MRKIVGLMAALVVLVSCSSRLSYDPLPEQNADSATISVFRDQTGYEMVSESLPAFWVIAVDGRNLARLNAAEYVVIPVAAGESHKLTIKSWSGWWAEESVTSIFEAGQSYNYLAVVDTSRSKQLIPMSEDEAAVWRAKNTLVSSVR